MDCQHHPYNEFNLLYLQPRFHHSQRCFIPSVTGLLTQMRYDLWMYSLLIFHLWMTAGTIDNDNYDTGTKCVLCSMNIKFMFSIFFYLLLIAVLQTKLLLGDIKAIIPTLHFPRRLAIFHMCGFFFLLWVILLYLLLWDPFQQICSCCSSPSHSDVLSPFVVWTPHSNSIGEPNGRIFLFT